MRETETPSKPSAKRKSLAEIRGYDVTSEGQIVVDVDRLLRSPRTQELARMARIIVEKSRKR